jgi:hypothetical protein
MSYVWLATLAQLVTVSQFRGNEGTFNDRSIALGVVDLGEPQNLTQSGRVGTVL